MTLQVKSVAETETKSPEGSELREGTWWRSWLPQWGRGALCTLICMTFAWFLKGIDALVSAQMVEP